MKPAIVKAIQFLFLSTLIEIGDGNRVPISIVVRMKDFLIFFRRVLPDVVFLNQSDPSRMRQTTHIAAMGI